MEGIAALVVLLCAVEAFKEPRYKMLQQNHVIAPIEVENISSRIVNGQVAQAHQFPYMVGLLFRNTHEETWCGGSLISYEWVLTAAHCIYGKLIADVFLGSTRLRGGEVRYALRKNMIIPPEFSTNSVHNDIGLIVLIPPVTHSLAIVPIALPRVGFHIDIGSIAVTSGWGFTNIKGPKSESLLYTDLRVITHDQCKTYHGFEIVDETMLCTLPNLGGSTCEGDSGGPLVLRPSQVLIGISSFRHSSGCSIGKPDGFTRIIPFLGRIRNITGIYT